MEWRVKVVKEFMGLPVGTEFPVRNDNDRIYLGPHRFSYYGILNYEEYFELMPEVVVGGRYRIGNTLLKVIRKSSNLTYLVDNKGKKTKAFGFDLTPVYNRWV